MGHFGPSLIVYKPFCDAVPRMNQGARDLAISGTGQQPVRCYAGDAGATSGLEGHRGASGVWPGPR